MAASRNTPSAAPADTDPEVEIAVEVNGKAPRQPRRRGRPPESDGLTEQRILEAARICFAESGYAGTSTHAVAARANLTTGALYHYFDAKRDLYVAVFHQVEEFVYERLRAVVAGQPTLAASVGAMFDEVVRLNKADATLARFMQTVTADVSRHADLREAFQIAWPRRDEFFRDLVDIGVANGELAARDRRMVIDTITSMMVGLIGVSDLVPGAQARSVEGFKRLINGMLLRNAPSSR